MSVSLRTLIEKLRGVLHLDDAPPRIALALAVGVFIGCTPFYGLQTLLSVLVATVFRLNRAVTVTGTWLNLPWFTPLLYGAALKVGTLVVPDPDGMRSAWLDFVVAHPGRLRWADIVPLLGEVSGALLVGTTIVGAVAAVATYAVAVRVIARRRARRGRPDAPRRHAA